MNTADAPYAAPEQLHGDPTSSASDVFSWATLLATWVLGESPWDGSSLDEIRSRMDECESRAGAPEFEAFGEVLELCWRRDPSQRPRAEDVQAILKDLRSSGESK